MIKNAELQADVCGFIGQEAHHGYEHDALNTLMTHAGMPTRSIEVLVKNFLDWYARHISPERQLAKTVALEHFTAMFGEMILLHPEILEGAHPQVKQLWLWHALEEVEHKSVAFDVYKEQVDNEWVSLSEMIVNTFTFLGFYSIHYFQLSHQINDKTDWHSIYHGWQWLLGKKNGILTKIGKHYLEFYNKDFHPDQRNTESLVEQWRQKLNL